MYRDHTVGVVVPAYNEAANVAEVVETLPPFVDRAYVVDDGSTDDTWAVIREAAAAFNDEHPPTAGFDARVVPIRHAENRGVGGAIKTGYRRALADGIEATAVMGGDGQMDPDLLPALLDPVVEGRADYAKGNRFLAPETLDAMPRFRLVGNRILSVLTKVASGYWGSADPQNGYTVISRRALEAVDLEGMFEYYGYCNDLLVRLNVVGARVADVAHPSDSVYDEDDWDSHIQYSEYIPRVSWMLLRTFLWRLTRLSRGRVVHPVALAYGLGAVAVAASLLGGVASLAGERLPWIWGLGLGAALLVAGAVGDRAANDRSMQVTDASAPESVSEPSPRPAEDD